MVENLKLTKPFSLVGIKWQADIWHITFFLARSLYFHNMFTNDENTKDNMSINDVKAEAFQAFLHYIYCDDIEITEDTVSDLIKIGKKYQNDEIKGACEKKLIASLTEDNALDLFVKAHHFKFCDLKQLSFGILEETFKVRYSLQLPKEAVDLPERVIAIHKMFVDTFEAFKELHLGAKAEAEEHLSADESTTNNNKEKNGQMKREETIEAESI